jgi:hypothetical protein
VGGALLVAHQDMAQLVLLEQLVIDREHGAAGIAENVVHALVGKRPQHDLRAGHQFFRFAAHAGHPILSFHLDLPNRPLKMKKARSRGLFSRTTPGGAAYTTPAVRDPTIRRVLIMVPSFSL